MTTHTNQLFKRKEYVVFRSVILNFKMMQNKPKLFAEILEKISHAQKTFGVPKLFCPECFQRSDCRKLLPFTTCITQMVF